MKITVENKEIINPKNISVHDGIIEKFEYNYLERICNIEILNDCWNIRQTFCIKNIILMHQQNCEFWGCSPHVHCWCYDEGQPFLKQLWIKQKSDKQFERTEEVLRRSALSQGMMIETAFSSET